MAKQSGASQNRDAFIADALREESHNAPNQSLGNDNRPRQLGLLSGHVSVYFGKNLR